MDLRNLSWVLAVKDKASGIIAGVNKSIDELKEGMAGTQKKFKEMNKDLEKVGKGMTKWVTTPLIGIATAGIKTVSDFDDSMSKVQAISGATQEEFKKLRDQSKGFAKHSAKDAAAGQEILAASGMKVNEILSTTPGLLTLMKAGSVDANVSAKVLTGTMAQFNLTAEDSNRIVDVFAKGAASANTNVGEMQEAFKMAGGDLANMNMDIEQSAAMTGILANANLVGSQAGTILSSMSREIKSNSREFKKLGIEVYDSTGKMRDMGSILTDVEKLTGDMTDAQRDAALSTVFTGQAMRGVNAFVRQGSNEYKKLTESIYDAEGAGLLMAETMEGNIGGAFRELKVVGEGFLIEVGDVFKDDIREFAGLATGLLGNFNKLDDGTKKMIIKVAGLATAVGPLLFGFSKLNGFAINLPDNIKMLKGAFGALTNPVGLAIGAIAGLIAVGVHLYKTNDEVKEKIDTAWAGIKDTVSVGVDFVKGLWDDMGEDIIAIVGVAWRHIQDVFTLGIDIVAGVVGIIKGIMTGDWLGAWESAVGIVENAFVYFAGLPAKMFDIGKNMISVFGKGLKSVGTSAWNNTLGKIPGLKIDGSHAAGLNRVPKDNYVGNLHRDEMVLPRDTANTYRKLGGTKDRLPLMDAQGSSREGINFNPTISITVQGNADKQTAIDIGEEVNKQLELFFRKLNLQRG